MWFNFTTLPNITGTYPDTCISHGIDFTSY